MKTETSPRANGSSAQPICRGNLSGLISAGAGGKTTVRIVQLLSAASDRSLTGEHVFVRCRVMIVCLEDDMKELRRRVRAAMLHHKVTPKDVKGLLILTTPRGLKIAELESKTGKVVAGGLYRALVKAIDELKLDIVCIDPAIKAHSVKGKRQPRNRRFRFAADRSRRGEKHRDRPAVSRAQSGRRQRWRCQSRAGRGLAQGRSSASHTRSPACPRPKPRRWGSARTSACSSSGSTAPRSTSRRRRRTATWFRLVGVNLGNGNATYPNGDNVQTVERWTPAPLFDGLSTADLNCVLRKLGAGMGDGRRYSLASAAKDRAAWHAVQEQFPELDQARCRAIIAAWKKNELFEIGDYDDPVRRTKATGILSAKLIGQSRTVNDLHE